MKLERELKREGILLKERQIENLKFFIEKLQLWSKTHNITRIKGEDEIIKNIVDALIPINFVKKPKNMVDIGTGAGFPGLILAIAWDDIEVVLAEPISKRASFLRYMVTLLGLSGAEVFRDRVEKIKNRTFELVTSRAVTDTKLLLKLTENITDRDSRYLFYKGSRVFKEVDDSIKERFKIVIESRGVRNYLILEPKR